MKKILCFFIIASLTLNCSKEIDFKFFVAGHIYGTPNANSKGFYTPFTNAISSLKSDTNLAFGVFTGDIVEKSTNEHWQAFIKDKQLLNVQLHYVFGNHDLKGDTSLTKYYLGQPFYRLKKENTNFIFLDGNIDGWSIKGDQLQFLKKTLQSIKKGENIFIFSHQILWWKKSDDPDFKYVNSLEGRLTPTNFYNTVLPLLHQKENAVYWVAGDIGALRGKVNYSYNNLKNVHLIASGMGNKVDDNFLICTIYKDGSVEWEIVRL